ncbi:CubicO group peptidase (beta-lactamase class C family) [Microbacterium sp. W4I4]|uniref:serine hydrolase domain-containing protein n=1 Tax=Microbacterium sp. W4I4 TaxID=3042295 RepID=UPI002785B2DC|nr:serine hydrolase domain-containing protein [Microbacterium sp. W4I4]MDQ0614588.1 CubicO group peptidase (beta-lactamase class C family) [Microbacterium sp. W4I4]
MMSDALPEATPESHGLPAAAVLRLIDDLEQSGLDPHALVIARHGHVLFRGAWQPWTPHTQSLVYSVSKTFTAIAIGLLESDGLIDVTAPVDRYLDLPNPHGLTVRHLLTMNTGHSAQQVEQLPFDAAALLTTAPAHIPGEHFAYNSPASFALSAIATAITGRSLTDLLKGRLFDPLGIGNRWWKPLDGIDEGFSGLHLDIGDLARIGIALADDGVFDGRQVIPRDFIRAATTPWSDTSGSESSTLDWTLGYGYQLWRSRHGFRLDGAYGQFSLIVPESGVVVAYQGATTRTQETLNAIWRLVESFQDSALAEDPADASRLADRIAALDSWRSRDRLIVDATPVPDAADWSLTDAGEGRWMLTTPHGPIEVDEDWSRTVLGDVDGDVDGDGQESLAVAARGEARADGSVLVHLVVPTSPHRLIITRDAEGLHLGWHAVPLWAPVIDTLLVPEHVARVY